MATHGLFVSHRGFLANTPGGVQICTREFMDVIGAAGIALELLPVDDDRRWTTRLMRRANSSPFFRPFAPDLVARIRDCCAQTRFDFIFLNQEVLSALARDIRPLLPGDCRIVVLSHGLELTDLLHAIRVRDHMPLSQRIRPSPAIVLGHILMSERRSRDHVDAVCAISPFDADLERWLGTRRVAWIPRTITSAPISWQPVTGRLGFVGTLDHAPNLEGLVRVLEVLASGPKESPRVRVVGGPRETGIWLGQNFANVDFLGPLADPELEAEAATWTAFIHPIFCLPRGCSTKLAAAIAWHIPIVTTPQGRRGYVWREGRLLEADGPQEFVRHCLSLEDHACARQAQRDVIRVAASSPSLADAASMMRSLLD